MRHVTALFRGHEPSRLLAGTIVAAVLGLVVWTVFLAKTLPAVHSARHWDAAWAGFDVALIATLAATAWAAWFRRQILVAAALVAGTLLVCDAWFDIVTSLGTRDQTVTIATALLAELPVAAFLFWLARTIMLRTVAAFRSQPGQQQLGAHLRAAPLLFATQAEGAEQTESWALAETVRTSATATLGSPMLVEILYFEGCPNHEPARALVERLSRELAVDPEIRMVEVPDAEAALRLRFLGSPTVRVDGHDVEPGADKRDEFMLACRVYRTDSGFAGVPDERWLRDRLAADG